MSSSLSSLTKSEPTFSLEFYPPKDELGEMKLWESLASNRDLKPDFVSVTYGAGGSTRDRTARITSEITKKTGIATIAHLTCVGSTKIEIENVLMKYQLAEITTVLALRGDPPTGPGSDWVSTPDGIDHADELVSLARSKDFKVGVAAFPDGHPASVGNFAKDIDVLIEKERRGASFATTQFFFDATKYFSLVAQLQRRGSLLPIIPGILPITNLKQLQRMAYLGGTPIPEKITSRFMGVNDHLEIRAIGVEIAVELCRKLIAGGVPGLHFYTLNDLLPTREIVERLGLRNSYSNKI